MLCTVRADEINSAVVFQSATNSVVVGSVAVAPVVGGVVGVGRVGIRSVVVLGVGLRLRFGGGGGENGTEGHQHNLKFF